MTLLRSFGRASLAFTLSGVAALACGQESPADDGSDGPPPPYEGLGIAHSGTRLDAIGSYFASGVGTGYEFYDNELKSKCSASQLRGDDQIYCVPAAFVEVVFPNDDCDEGEAIAFLRENSCDSALEAGDLVHTIFPPTDGDTCSSQRELYRLGEATEPPATRYWRSYPDGTCQASGDDRAGLFWKLEVAERTGLARFHSATLESDDAAISVRGVAGEDGSFLPVAFGFGERECRPTRTARGTRCLPDLLRSTGTAFLDGACETEATSALGSFAACAEVPDLVATLDTESSCGEVVAAIYGIEGEPVTAFTKNGDACDPLPAPTTAIVVGAEVGLTAFPELGEKWVREGELEASFVTSGEATIGNATGFRIASTKEPCTIAEFADGSRCVPGALFTTAAGLYSDADCESPISTEFLGACAVDASAVTFVEREADACSSSTTAAYRARPYTGDVFQEDSTGACVSLDAVDGQLFFEKGAALELDEMPLIPSERAR